MEIGTSYHVKVDPSGRIVLPAETRARHQIGLGDTVVVIDEPTGVRIRTPQEVLAEAQAYFTKLIPPGVSLADELLAERRSEVERD